MIGLISVCVMIASGILNTWFLAGNWQSRFGTESCRALMAKIAIFVAMTCLAAINRFYLTPKPTHVPAQRRLYVNYAIEFASVCVPSGDDEPTVPAR